MASFPGVAIDLRGGWKTAPPSCGQPADRTVVWGATSGSCPASLPAAPTTAILLSPIYGRQFALSWLGRRTRWHGQLAWTSHTRTSSGLTTYVLALPWLNVVVAAQSGDAATAQALLARVHERPVPGLGVPAGATWIFVQSLAGHDGDGLERNVKVTDARDIRRLLDDLRALPAVTDPSRACDGGWWPRTATLTVHGRCGTRTFAARFDRCGLVVSGTGSAATTSRRLLADVERLVPDAGL
jgi:hypothetical protein